MEEVVDDGEKEGRGRRTMEELTICVISVKIKDCRRGLGHAFDQLGSGRPRSVVEFTWWEPKRRDLNGRWYGGGWEYSKGRGAAVEDMAKTSAGVG